MPPGIGYGGAASNIQIDPATGMPINRPPQMQGPMRPPPAPMPQMPGPQGPPMQGPMGAQGMQAQALRAPPGGPPQVPMASTPMQALQQGGGQAPMQMQQPGGGGSMPMHMQLNQMEKNDPEGYKQFMKGMNEDYDEGFSGIDKQMGQAQALRDAKLHGGYGRGGKGDRFVADNPLSLIGTGIKQWRGRQQAKELEAKRAALTDQRVATNTQQMKMKQRAGK